MPYILLFLILPIALFGDECEKRRPFHFMGRYDYLGYAKFQDDKAGGQKIGYRVGEAEGGMVVLYNPCYDEMLDLSASYLYNFLGWKHNGYFHQSNYNIATARVAFITHRLCDWEWQGYIKAFINIDHPDFQHYLYWDFVLWGIYQLNPCMHFHVGLYGETGMKADHLFPIIGFDWKYSERIRINLIFPMDLSVLYIINDCWDIGIAQRFFRARNRVGKDEPLSMGMWEYSNTGTEIGMDYRRGDWLLVNAHAGYAWDGKIRVDNKSRKKAKHYNFDGCPYLGFEGNVRF
jgi:hypothetical protein